MKIQDIDLKQLLPLFMRRQEDNAALADALSEPLRVFAREIAKLSTFGHLEDLTVEELDDLADELRVLWYDRSFTPEQKRVLLATSDKVYMRLGTKAAVQQVLTDIFGTSFIDEFWEYGADPHFFRIRVANPAALTRDNIAKLMRLLEEVQRKSQWLEKILCELRGSLQLNVGLHLTTQQDVYITLNNWQTHTETPLNIANAQHDTIQETILNK